jgi:MFS family permease
VGTAARLTRRSARARLPREVWVLVAANLAIALGYALVAPALPTFARGFDVSVTAASVVVSAFAVARLVFAPVSGRLVTVLGEQRVYLAGLAIVAVTTGMCAFATAYWQLVTLRTLSGIGSTMFTVSAIGLMIRLTPAPLRGRASGLWGTSFLLGNVLGPLIGGGLITISLRAPFVVYAASLLVAMAIVWLFLRHSTLAAADAEDDVPVASLRETLRHRTYVAALISSFANGWTAFGVRMALTPLFITEVLHREDAFAGTAFAVFGAGNVVMLLLSGKLSDSLGRKPVVLAGLVLAGFGTIWVGFTSSVPAFLIATGRRGRHHRQRHPRRPGPRRVPDDPRRRCRARPVRRRPTRRPAVIRLRVRRDRRALRPRRPALAHSEGNSASPSMTDSVKLQPKYLRQGVRVRLDGCSPLTAKRVTVQSIDHEPTRAS